MLGRGDVLDGVAELVDRIELEPLFADGPRLIVLIEPVARDGPPDLDRRARARVARRPAVDARGREPGRGAGRRHVALPLLRDQPRAALRPRARPGACAWRSRPARRSCSRPASRARCALVAVRRRARDPRPRRAGRRAAGRAGALDAALALARERGYAVPAPDRVRLGDSDLWVDARARRRLGPDEIVPGLGRHACATGSACARSAAASTSRSSAAWCSTRCSASAGRRSASATGASCAVGRAGNPDTMDGDRRRARRRRPRSSTRAA